MSTKRLSDYAEVEYTDEDANPLRIAVRGATGEGHQFGDVGEVHLTEDEAEALRAFLDAALSP